MQGVTRPIDPKWREKLSRHFNLIHESLAEIRDLVGPFDDPVAMKLVEDMEIVTLKPMRRLRLHLDVPYDPRDAEI